MLTAWPPPEVLVTVRMTAPVFSLPRPLLSASLRWESALPLNGSSLAAGASIVGHRQNERADVFTAALADERVHALDVGAALEWKIAFGLRRNRRHAVNGLGPAELDVGARRIKMGVAQKGLAPAAQVSVQNALGRPSLVGRKNIWIAGQVMNGPFKALPADRARIGFISLHHSRPLRRAHGRRPAVGQQINDDLLRLQLERVVAGFRQVFFALRSGGQGNGLNRLDAKRLDDCVELLRHGLSLFKDQNG